MVLQKLRKLGDGSVTARRNEADTPSDPLEDDPETQHHREHRQKVAFQCRERTGKHRVNYGEFRGTPNCRSKPPQPPVIRQGPIDITKHDLPLPQSPCHPQLNESGSVEGYDSESSCDASPPPMQSSDSSDAEALSRDTDCQFWVNDNNEFFERPQHHAQEIDLVEHLFHSKVPQSAEPKASVTNDVLQPNTVTLGCRPSSSHVLFQGVHVPLEDILGVVCHTISGNGDGNFSGRC